MDISTPSHYIAPENIPGYVKDGSTALGRFFKRLIDLLASALALILFSPLFLICAAAIRREDGKPVIYRQERIGRHGKTFHIYKFRSMRVDAEKDGPCLSHEGGNDDPRLTKVGRFLRAHHLDELPQLWNVFVGDMAFVGPRPERPYFIEQIMEKDSRYACLYQIRPGVTSYATLHNGYTDTLDKMLQRMEYDLQYLRHHNLWTDAGILFKTFFQIFSGKIF